MAKSHTIHVILNVFLLLGLLGALVTFTWDGPLARGGAGQYTFKDVADGTSLDTTTGSVCGSASVATRVDAWQRGYIDQNITSITVVEFGSDAASIQRTFTIIDFKDVFEEYPANGHVTEMFILSWVFFFVSFVSIVFVFYWMFHYGKDKRAAFEEKHRGAIKALHIFFYLLILGMSVTSIALMAMSTADNYKDQMEPSSLAKINDAEPYDSDNACWMNQDAMAVWNLAMASKCTPSGIGDDACNMPIFLILFYTTTSLLTATSLACLVVYMMTQEMWPFKKTVRMQDTAGGSRYTGGKDADPSDAYVTPAETNQLIF